MKKFFLIVAVSFSFATSGNSQAVFNGTPPSGNDGNIIKLTFRNRDEGSFCWNEKGNCDVEIGFIKEPMVGVNNIFIVFKPEGQFFNILQPITFNGAEVNLNYNIRFEAQYPIYVKEFGGYLLTGKLE